MFGIINSKQGSRTVDPRKTTCAMIGIKNIHLPHRFIKNIAKQHQTFIFKFRR